MSALTELSEFCLIKENKSFSSLHQKQNEALPDLQEAPVIDRLTCYNTLVIQLCPASPWQISLDQAEIICRELAEHAEFACGWPTRSQSNPWCRVRSAVFLAAHSSSKKQIEGSLWFRTWTQKRLLIWCYDSSLPPKWGLYHKRILLNELKNHLSLYLGFLWFPEAYWKTKTGTNVGWCHLLYVKDLTFLIYSLFQTTPATAQPLILCYTSETLMIFPESVFPKV